mgnify:CR=1 FL=1
MDVAFVTLGCAKNEVDTDKMRARVQGAGYSIAEDALDARLVVVNTCSFLVSAAEESLDTIFDLIDAQAASPRKGKLLVAGCMPARYGSDLENELVEAAGFLDASEEERIVDAVASIIGPPEFEMPGHVSAYETLRSDVGTSAYVKISDGCNRFCTYCMIPYIRGRYHSFSMDDILDEVGELVGKGAGEIVFIGQDTGIWGHDLGDGQNLEALLRTAATSYPQTWFRVLYLQPSGITDGLLDLVDSMPNICPYFDIPLQHANADVLARMNRSGSPSEYLQLVRRIRERVRDVTVRTTLMAGFPQETPEQFEELMNFVDDAEFDYAVVFPYSQETGSAAAAFEHQVDEDEKLLRAQRLLDACENIGFRRAAAHVGEVLDVLVEGYEETDVGMEAVGRWMGQAPEVDGQIHIRAYNGHLPDIGTKVHARITESFCYDLEGELV